MELVWENGQVSKRGRSTSSSSFRCSSHNYNSPKAQAWTTTATSGEDIHTRKTPRLGIFNSGLYLDDCSLMGNKEVSKQEFSLQDQSTELFHSLIRNDVNMFLETATGNNPYYYYYDKHITEPQIVPEFKDKNSSRPEINASAMEIPELETAKINKGEIYKSNSFQKCQRSARISKSIVNSKVVLAEDSAGLVPEPASGSKNTKNMQQIRQMANPEDEQSQAPGDQSVSSLGASNDPSYSSFNKTQLMECPSENNAEDQQVPKSARSGRKRRPTQEVHKISERKRRDKINKKMRELQALIPNSDKVDKVLMLDQAIEYLQTLQLQLKIMSLGNGLCMHSMMLPTGMQQIQASHFGHFSPMGMGSNSGMLGVGVAGAQLVPMPMPLSVPQPPFIPLVSGGSSAVTPMELMQRSASLLSSKSQSSIHVCSCKSISLDQEKKKKKKKKEKNQCKYA